MQKLSTQIFLDGADPAETAEAKKLLGHIDGQTTNPTLVAKNPEVQKYLQSGKRLTEKEALNEYKKIIQAIARITTGPISIQVIADGTTPVDEMLRQARIYKDWIPNGVIKFSTTGNGLAAAEKFCKEWSVNLTLNFSQEQAAAVYLATLRRGTSPQGKPYQVFISPFVGRLDDRGINGMDIVKNELDMFNRGDGHVIVLAASLRKLDHLFYALNLKSPVVTSPLKILQQWKDKNLAFPDAVYRYDPGPFKPIQYQELTLRGDWRKFNIKHELTYAGLKKFMEDWRGIIK